MADGSHEQTTPERSEDRPSEARPDIGSRVNAIIEAAASTAEQIERDARTKESEILRDAEARAAARIEQLTREATALRNEADQYARDIREAADSYGTQHRRSAEEEARRALADGRYGICVDCGKEIPAARLEAMPESIRCVDDQRLYEARLRQG
jgi:RNA polymerase-binding transcription factor DksA